jgi:hypothetical protein
MARTTVDDVKEILDTGSLTDAQITAFIGAATILVDDVSGDSCMDATRLAEIERWLAAHLVSMRALQPVREKIGDASVTYGTSDAALGQGLKSTLYGQQALALDCSGILGRSSAPKMSVKTIDYNKGAY